MPDRDGPRLPQILTISVRYCSPWALSLLSPGKGPEKELRLNTVNSGVDLLNLPLFRGGILFFDNPADPPPFTFDNPAITEWIIKMGCQHGDCCIFLSWAASMARRVSCRSSGTSPQRIRTVPLNPASASRAAGGSMAGAELLFLDSEGDRIRQQRNSPSLSPPDGRRQRQSWLAPAAFAARTDQEISGLSADRVHDLDQT